MQEGEAPIPPNEKLHIYKAGKVAFSTVELLSDSHFKSLWHETSI